MDQVYDDAVIVHDVHDDATGTDFRVSYSHAEDGTIAFAPRDEWVAVRQEWVPIEEADSQKGGPGSGFFGHAGRPGQVGGSRPADVALSGATGKDRAERQAAARARGKESSKPGESTALRAARHLAAMRQRAADFARAKEEAEAHPRPADREEFDDYFSDEPKTTGGRNYDEYVAWAKELELEKHRAAGAYVAAEDRFIESLDAMEQGEERQQLARDALPIPQQIP